jgi:hypothetical protein
MGGCNSRVLIAGVAFLMSYMGALLLIKYPVAGRAGQLAAAAVAVGAFVWFLTAEIRVIRNLDELQRRIQLEALAIAFPCAIVSIMALGFVERIVPLSMHDLSYRHVWPYLSFFYFIGLATAQRRYQ